MTELTLYKFIEEESLEFNWVDGDVLLFVNHYQLGDFMKLLGAPMFDDEGIECVMKHGYVCVFMQDICDRCGIEIENVFGKEESKNG